MPGGSRGRDLGPRWWRERWRAGAGAGAGAGADLRALARRHLHCPLPMPPTGQRRTHQRLAAAAPDHQRRPDQTRRRWPRRQRRQARPSSQGSTPAQQPGECIRVRACASRFGWRGDVAVLATGSTCGPSSVARPGDQDRPLTRRWGEDSSTVVYHRCMARTNVDIDEEACRAVMSRYHLATKREAVNLALRLIAGEPLSVEAARALRAPVGRATLRSSARAASRDPH